ncbi:MAG: uracil phosphoribosyltransferase [Collinsella sp.]
MTVTYDTSRVTLVDHPLVQHKLSILRDKSTGTNQFRQLVRELALFDGYEAMRDLPMEDVEVETPITTAMFKQLAGKKLAIVPILRAGLAWSTVSSTWCPPLAWVTSAWSATRSPTSRTSTTARCPRTSTSASAWLSTPCSLRAARPRWPSAICGARCQDIRMLCIVAAPEGLKSLTEKDPDVHIYTCAIDDHLNEAAYIVPGLGDAGDRIYGTL